MTTICRCRWRRPGAFHFGQSGKRSTISVHGWCISRSTGT